MKRIIAFFFIVTFASSSCEKDDICDANTPTTPRLVIEFYNFTTPSILKNVTSLKVIGKDKLEGIVFNSSGGGENKYLTNGSKIAIPLKTDAKATTFSFILNSGNPNTALIDTDELTFNYTTNAVYVSRACGFKTLFAFDPLNPYIHAASPTTKLTWIRTIAVEKNIIDNENETHIKVFF